jgi:hypothetical protein
MVEEDEVVVLTCSHSDSGTRSPWPEKADLSYWGILVGFVFEREEKTERARGISWVEGWPRCWRSGLSGWESARETWSAWVR